MRRLARSAHDPDPDASANGATLPRATTKGGLLRQPVEERATLIIYGVAHLTPTSVRALLATRLNAEQAALVAGVRSCTPEKGTYGGAHYRVTLLDAVGEGQRTATYTPPTWIEIMRAICGPNERGMTPPVQKVEWLHEQPARGPAATTREPQARPQGREIRAPSGRSVPTRNRQRPQPTAATKPPKKKNHIVMGSWNVPGLAANPHKTLSARHVINTSRIEIIGFQETHSGRGPDGHTSPKIPGFVACPMLHDPEQPGGTAGRHGGALHVANKLTAVEYCPPSPYLSAARIYVEGGEALVVANMYVPVSTVKANVPNLKPRTVATKQMMALIKGFYADHPEGNLLIMGDMNRSADALDKFLQGKMGKAMGMQRFPLAAGGTQHTRAANASVKGPGGVRQKRVACSCPDHFTGPTSLVQAMRGATTPLQHLSGRTSDHLMLKATVPLTPLRRPAPAKVPSVSKLELGKPGMGARIKLHPAWRKATKIILGWDTELPSGATREQKREEKLNHLLRNLRNRHSAARRRAARAEMDRDAKLTRDTLETVLTDLGIMRIGRPKKRAPMMSKSVETLLQQRMAVDRSVMMEQSKPPDQRDKKEVARLKKQARKLARRGSKAHRRDRLGSYERYVSEGMEHLVSGDAKRAFAHMRSAQGRGRRAAVTQPRLDADGSIVVTAEDVARVSTDHWRSISADEDGASKHMPSAQREVLDNRRGKRRRTDPLPGSTIKLRVKELLEAVHVSKRGKAAGSDRLPAEVYHLLLPVLVAANEGEGSISEYADSGAQELLIHYIRTTWESGYVPGCDKIQILVEIFKGKGSEMDLDNSRGIALTNALLRIVDVIGQLRLTVGLDLAESICREQGGFQAMEEVLAQNVGLWATATRRAMAGLTTYISLRDLRKAFDRTPHAALMAKCREAGARKQLMRHLKGRHRGPRVKIKLPCGVTEAFRYLIGLLQGGGCSPVQFLLFINDVFDAAREEEVGVAIPADPCFERVEDPDDSDGEEIERTVPGGGIQFNPDAEAAEQLPEATFEEGEQTPGDEMDWRAKANRIELQPGALSEADRLQIRACRRNADDIERERLSRAREESGEPSTHRTDVTAESDEERSRADKMISLIIGFLFADDASDCSGDMAMMRRAWELADKWARTWGMSYGIKKCGVMVIPGIHCAKWNEPSLQVDDNGVVSARPVDASQADSEDENTPPPPTMPWCRAMQELYDNPPVVGGQKIPVVLWYEYLGSIMHCTGSQVPTIMANVRKTRKRVADTVSFCASRAQPMQLKLMALSSQITSKATFGGELFGMPDNSTPGMAAVNEEGERCDLLDWDGSNLADPLSAMTKLQTVLDRASVSIVTGRLVDEGKKPPAVMPIIRLEARTRSIEAMTNGNRLRATVKYVTSRRPVAFMLKRPYHPPGLGSTWATGTRESIIALRATVLRQQAMFKANKRRRTEKRSVSRLKHPCADQILPNELKWLLDSDGGTTGTPTMLLATPKQSTMVASVLSSIITWSELTGCIERGNLTAKRYAEHETWLTVRAGTRRPWCKDRSTNDGAQYIMRMRAEAFYFANRLKHFPRSMCMTTDNGCPHCGLQRDTLPHMLFECGEFTGLRELLGADLFTGSVDRLVRVYPGIEGSPDQTRLARAALLGEDRSAMMSDLWLGRSIDLGMHDRKAVEMGWTEGHLTQEELDEWPADWPDLGGTKVGHTTYARQTTTAGVLDGGRECRPDHPYQSRDVGRFNYVDLYMADEGATTRSDPRLESEKTGKMRVLGETKLAEHQLRLARFFSHVRKARHRDCHVKAREGRPTYVDPTTI